MILTYKWRGISLYASFKTQNLCICFIYFIIFTFHCIMTSIHSTGKCMFCLISPKGTIPSNVNPLILRLCYIINKLWQSILRLISN